MILLEQLKVRELGALHRVDLAFRPQGHHLVTVQREQAQALHAALMTCLYGPSDSMRARSDGAVVECRLAAGGRPITVRRTLRATGRDEAEVTVHRGPRSTTIRGDAQVRATIDDMLGLDQETLQLLTQPQPRSEVPPPAQVRALLRHLLGETRIEGLEYDFTDSPAHLEEEAVARARVELAQAVAEAGDTESEIARLDRLLQQWRVRQALQALTAASERAAQADAAERRDRGLRSHFREQRDSLAARRELAVLWADHARATAEATRARDEAERLDAELAEIAPLAERARAGAERLAALDRACAAVQSGAAASREADRARGQRDERHQAAHELRRARSDLVEAEVIHGQARAAAERAQTLRKRAHEEEHLPTAHRLWSQLCEILDAELEHIHDGADDPSLDHEIIGAKQSLRGLAIEAQRRRMRLMTSASGGAVGIILATIGFTGTAPLAVLGVLAVLASAAVAAWSLWTQRADQVAEADLHDHLAALEHDRRVGEQDTARTAADHRLRTKIEQTLQRHGLEIPTSLERAHILRDSATARLRRLADGDSGAVTADLEAAYTRTQQELAHAEREVQRLRARIQALEASGVEDLAAAAEAELRQHIEASGRARRQASELARSLGLADDHRALTEARDTQRRDLDALQDRLDEGARLETARPRMVQRQREAENSLPGIAQAIDTLVSTDSELPRFEPPAGAIARLDGLAAFAEVIAAVGETRATSQVSQANGTARAAHDAVARATADLAGAVQATGAHVDAAPTVSEVRAIFPELESERLDDPAAARKKMQQARASRRELDAQIRQLELRTGAVRHEVDLEASRAALDDLVDQRRVRAAASRMMAQALDALVGGVLPATEAALRQIIGRVTGGSHWDVRITENLTVNLWDEDRSAWMSVRDVAVGLREAVMLAAGVAFISALRPHDAPHAPAFLWLDAAATGANAEAIETVLDALAQPGLQRHFPQVIATATPGGLSRAGFDRVATIADGISEPSTAHAATARWLKAVG